MWIYPFDSSSESSSDSFDEDFFDHYDKDEYYSDSEDDGVTSLEKLKSLRELPRGNEEERHEFLSRFHRRVCHWKGELPNLKDIFQPEVMECLLLDVVNYIAKCRDRVAEQIIKFVVKTGYRDEFNAEKDGGGEPSSSSLRTTPIHHAARRKLYWIISDLFKIYDRFDANYTDESGLSHFHVACGQYGCDDVVEKFLELGQVDPNFLVPETDDSPLHLAVGDKKTTELLLKNGANPNLINKDGLTPLLIICQKKVCWHDNQYADLAEMFLKISEEKNQAVQVDAKDKKLGLTSLQWAVVNISPKMIDVLLDHGADLSSFVFPTETRFSDALKSKTDMEDVELDEEAEFEKSMSSAVEIMSGLLTVAERLEIRGYELSRDDALTIMQVLYKNEFSWTSEQLWYDNYDFAAKAKKIMIIEDDPSLSLYDLVQLRPEEAAKRVTFRDYHALPEEFEYLPEWSRRHCASRLCEMMSRGFYRRWALDSLLKLAGHRLPILCCEMIIEPLMNDDLLCIFFAAKG
ncbi:unnamed protein product [Trichogramma brassicae]|uniref:Uncharacterized protein n=1 Tax=Trichogramma brassicae TaxID=86971 RepID=A0A6H5IQN6_9HYME|nr:unnamed protein product [Trichogramma brassicae]